MDSKEKDSTSTLTSEQEHELQFGLINETSQGQKRNDPCDSLAAKPDASLSHNSDDDKLEAIMALKELVKKQRTKITHLKHQRERRQQQEREHEKEEEERQKTVNIVEPDEELGMVHQLDEEEDEPLEEKASSNNAKEMMALSSRVLSVEEDAAFELSDDVYSMVFLADFASPSFWFGVGVFALKTLLYSFITIDLFDGNESFRDASTIVRTAQFFMLPVAIAIQEDLTTSYTMISNVKYDPMIREKCKGATNTKFHLSVCLRLIDGMFSLAVNVILLLQSTEVLSLFLNFAALQFLQNIDDVAFKLAADGFMTDGIEQMVCHVKTTSLPCKSNKVLTRMDSVMFLGTYIALVAAWITVTI